MNSIVAFPIALAYREPYSDDITQKIAVNKNNLRQYWYTITNYPDAQLVVCDTIEDCIKALKNGDADSTLLSALRVSHLLGNEKKLNIITLTDDEKVCFAIANGNTALLQIVNHGISILGESYGLNHTYRYLDSLATYTLTDVVQDHVWLFAGMMAVILILIILYFVRRERVQEAAARRDQKQKELLQEALFAARQASVAKKVFLQNMSHDIRTPMNAVIGFTNLAIQAGDDTEKVRDYLGKIQVSGNHLLGLVNEVLEISRIESGQTKLDEAVWNIEEIVKETDIIIRDQALEKQQKFILGMTIIKGFVDIMGGTIKIQSEENKGTEITVQLCLHLAKAPGELPKTENVEYPAELFAGKRILLAEDNILNREIAVAILEKTGFKVDIAENGAIAVEKVKNSTKGYYAAILMDIQMPVMDGYAATRAIRALEDPVLANIPVLAVSANAFDEDMAASRAAGMNGHLAKPVIASELLGTLGKVLFTDS